MLLTGASDFTRSVILRYVRCQHSHVWPLLADRRRSCAATLSERVRVSRHILAKFDRRDRVIACLQSGRAPEPPWREPGAPPHVAVAIRDRAERA